MIKGFPIVFKAFTYIFIVLCFFSSEAVASQPFSTGEQALRDKIERQRREYSYMQSLGMDMSDLAPLLAHLRQARETKNRDSFKELLNSIGLIQTQKLGGDVTTPPAISTLPVKASQNGDMTDGNTDLRNFGFGMGYLAGSPALAEDYAKTNIQWGKISPTQWTDIEPAPPTRDGRHGYKWDSLDRLVGLWQNAGMKNMVIHLKCNAPWATIDSPLPPGLSPEAVKAAMKVGRLQRLSSVPRDNMWENYEALITHIVERYDGDGFDDMPGLKYPVRYLEIESEAQHMGQWYGSSDDYLRLLKAAGLAARMANPDVKIVLSGFMFEDVMDDRPSESVFLERLRDRPGLARGLEFNVAVLRHPELFDAVEFHYLNDYRSAYRIVEWIRREMRKNGYEKPIWALDAFSGPLIFHSELNTPFPDKTERQELFAALKDKTHPRHRIVDKWFRREQSAIMTKKFIVGMELGMAGIVMGNVADWIHLWNLPSAFEKSTAPMGLIGVEIRDGKPVPGEKRPAYYTLKMLTGELQGKVTAVQRIAASDGLYAYRLSTTNGSLHVFWYENGSVKGPGQKAECKWIDISARENKFERIDIITDYGQTTPKREVVHLYKRRATLELDEVPVFLKGLNEVTIKEP